MFKPSVLIGLPVLLLLCSMNEPQLLAQTEIDFRTAIRPILSNRCFACHGPDEETIEGGLRLDSFETATKPADSGSFAIVAGNSSESEMLRRILSEDDGERMPPPHFGEKLTEREANLIRLWIDSGAKYSKHWAFDSVAAVNWSHNAQLPGFESWTTRPIDQLLLNKLCEKGWSPSPPADLRTLIRRVSMDLTGLPPTLDQQRRLLADPSPNTYEEWVDELLASPAFGEHWARKWLDLARYADSAGYADDPERTIWGYRDWVIRALNSNMPFDQFTLEQLAGDLLPNPNDDQLVATAFHRNTLTNNEGGTNDEEFRNVAVVDRVNTTMSVWMGVTMACAQCHSHKYDSISQKEYFEVFAIFNQSEDADRRDESPTLAWFTPDQRDRIEELKRGREDLETALLAADETLRPQQQQWEASIRSPIDWQPLHPSSVTSETNPTLKPAASAEDTSLIDLRSDAKRDRYLIEVPLSSPAEVAAWRGIRLETVPDASLPAGGAALGNGNFVLTDVQASLRQESAKGVQAKFIRIELPGRNKILSLAEVQAFAGDINVATSGRATQSSVDYAGAAERAIDGNTSGVYTDHSVTHTKQSDAPWWELELDQPHLIEQITVWNRTDVGVGERLAGAQVRLLDESRQELASYTIEKPQAENSISLVPSKKLKWTGVTADYAQSGFDAARSIDGDPKTGWAVGGAINQPHELILTFDSEDLNAAIGSWSGPMTLRISLGFESDYEKHVLSRFRLAATDASNLKDTTSVPASVLAIVRKDNNLRSEEESLALHQFYVSRISPERHALRDRLVGVNLELEGLQPATTVPTMKELPVEKQRPTFVQHRGNYKVHGEQVEPGFPSAFHPYQPPESPAVSTSGRKVLNRLDLAHWLMQRDNPLTARVVANRYWENLFGTGIVKTSEEFGSQGDLPTHPELLDYLAKRLIDLEWDTKAFLKEIVMSSAYRQVSTVSVERYEEDPDNLFLSRGPRFRATAEQIRDAALAAGGLLSHKMFGPPTRPPQPSMGLSAAFGSRTDWETSHGENRFRRGIYTQWRRSNPYPSMATFDAPNREVCVLKRDRTNTPLQALVTLNDPVFIEAAQGLARRVVVYELPGGSFEEQIVQVYEHAVSRVPTQREIDALRSLLEQLVDDLKGSPEQANRLATEPIGPLPADSDVNQLAAWTALCNVVLNLDEFLMKR
jgi:mono/diheme cytochrome c family protein